MPSFMPLCFRVLAPLLLRLFFRAPLRSLVHLCTLSFTSCARALPCFRDSAFSLCFLLRPCAFLRVCAL
jgi:hypothetical protein